MEVWNPGNRMREGEGECGEKGPNLRTGSLGQGEPSAGGGESITGAEGEMRGEGETRGSPALLVAGWSDRGAISSLDIRDTSTPAHSPVM